MTKTSDSGAHIADLMKIDKTALPADGGEQFNRLIFARSPYLLQHAENPVEWYEWGDDAFEKILLDCQLIVLISFGQQMKCDWAAQCPLGLLGVQGISPSWHNPYKH